MNKGRQVKLINVDTKEATPFESISACAKHLGVSFQYIHKIVNTGKKVNNLYKVISYEKPKKYGSVEGNFNFNQKPVEVACSVSQQNRGVFFEFLEKYGIDYKIVE